MERQRRDALGLCEIVVDGRLEQVSIWTGTYLVTLREGRVGEVEGRKGNADEAECRNRQVVGSLSSG